MKTVDRPQLNGSFVQAQVPCFSFYWCRDHFSYRPWEFGYGYTHLSARENEDYDKLWAYACSFAASKVEEDDGCPSYNSKGNLMTEPRYINTKDLVLSTCATGSMSSIIDLVQQTLYKYKPYTKQFDHHIV